MAGRKKIITVTGATGFVGRALVERLSQEKNITIRCLVRESSDPAVIADLATVADIRYGDIMRPDTLAAAFAGSWGVVNLAGYREFWSRSRDHFYAMNQRGAESVFRACLEAAVSKVVHVSTPLAYGVPEQIPFDEETTPGPHPSDYARSKYLGDEAGRRLEQEQGLPLTMVYLAAVIGAGDDKSTMEVGRAVEGKLPALVGADTTYTYVYVKDAAEAIVRALLLKESVGERYLIGDQRASTREYFNLIGDIANVAAPRWNIPERYLMPMAKGMEWLSKRTGTRPVIPLDVLKTTTAGSLLFNAQKSVQQLGMDYTPLRTALAESIAELKAV